MKTIQRIMLITLLIIGYSTVIMSQNLDAMPVAKRDSLLIATAKEVILKYGPGYYREEYKPTIERHTIPPKGEINKTGEMAGRPLYWVIFLYDEIKEQLEYPFAARVQIWADTGKPSSVFFGNGLGRTVSEDELRSDKEIEPVIYQARELAPIYEQKDGFFVENSKPVNMAELKAKGYVEQANGIWVKTRPDTPPVEAMRVLRREGFEERSGRMVRVRPAETTVKKK